MNASSAVDNQKVSICRLSLTNKELIVKALDISINSATTFARRHNLDNYPLPTELAKLKKQIEEGEELWLIESKSS